LRATASSTTGRLLYVAAGLALAAPSHADAPFTLRCSGLRNWNVGTGSATEVPERVINYYTLRVTGTAGMVYGWHEHSWSTLTETDPAAWTLQRDGNGMNWRLSINRNDGAWTEVWTGHQHTSSISGRCLKVALREPPEPPPDQ
jgi:hypothetical protein